ncbi:MAG: IS110 family transposase [Actinomycetota bacterium]|nr:IS110 family transposase [Actinomycetota bacterium]
MNRFPGPAQLSSWAGLTPKHHESDTKVHRGWITKQGSRLVRWAAVQGVQRVGKHTRLGQVRGPDRCPSRSQHRCRGRGPRAAHPNLLRAARWPHPRPGTSQHRIPTHTAVGRGPCRSMTPSGALAPSG